MPTNGGGPRSPRLRRLARRSSAEFAGPDGGAPPRPSEDADQEQCDMCAEPIGPEHRHLLDTSERRLMCCCRACALLFDRKAASGGHFRLVPDRRLRLDDFALDDPAWERLAIPVDMAFFFRNSELDRVVAFYPGPAGATESQLELAAWDEIARANPVVSRMEPDVEALLVNRARGARDHWLVPIDDCYDLVGLMRTRWEGLSGGHELWQELGRYFERLERRAKSASRSGTTSKLTRAPAVAGGEKEAAWQTT